MTTLFPAASAAATSEPAGLEPAEELDDDVDVGGRGDARGGPRVIRAPAGTPSAVPPGEGAARDGDESAGRRRGAGASLGAPPPRAATSALPTVP